MGTSTSVRVRASSLALPDFRNLGVLLRLILGVNALALLTVALQTPYWPAAHDAWLDMVARLEWPLLGCALALAGVQPLLARVSFWWGGVGVLLLAGLAASGAWWAVNDMVWEWNNGNMWRSVCWALGVAAVMLAYFDYRARVLSPAEAEVRLLALTARIRPHFFFNALNGVLGMIRSEPRMAERALEHLAVLFRRLMSDHREMRQVCDEISLCRDYLVVEELRLGDRLQVRWEVDEALMPAQMPPFLLQPLLENAIYHGIEPAERGEILIRGMRQGDRMEFEVSNPVIPNAPERPGNHMAMANIRERLSLFFDLEGTLEVKRTPIRHRVLIHIPFRVARSAKL